MKVARWYLGQFMSKQFLRFIAIGTTAALLNWGSGRLLSLTLSFSISVILAYGVGIASAFILNRIWVFPGSNRPFGQQVMWFVFINLFFFPIVWGASIGLGDYALPRLGIIRWAEPLGHAIAISVPMFLTFLAHKFLTFAGGGNHSEEQVK